MPAKIRAGDLVVLHQRWNVNANLLGIALGTDGSENWLVMWTKDDGQIGLTWHLTSALLVIDDTTLGAVRGRCNLVG